MLTCLICIDRIFKHGTHSKVFLVTTTCNRVHLFKEVIYVNINRNLKRRSLVPWKNKLCKLAINYVTINYEMAHCLMVKHGFVCLAHLVTKNTG